MFCSLYKLNGPFAIGDRVAEKSTPCRFSTLDLDRFGGAATQLKCLVVFGPELIRHCVWVDHSGPVGSSILLDRISSFGSNLDNN